MLVAIFLIVEGHTRSDWTFGSRSWRIVRSYAWFYRSTILERNCSAWIAVREIIVSFTWNGVFVLSLGGRNVNGGLCVQNTGRGYRTSSITKSTGQWWGGGPPPHICERPLSSCAIRNLFAYN